MKKYIIILLCGVTVLGFTACENGHEPQPEYNANNIPAFCNSLIGLSVEEADRKIQAQGFTANPQELVYANKMYTAQMGDHVATAGFYMYQKEDTLGETNEYQSFTTLTVEWENGVIRNISYQLQPNGDSLQEIALTSEEGLSHIAQQNHWELQYILNRGQECVREDVISEIKSHPKGYCSISVQATDTDFPQSLLFDDTAYGIAHMQSISIDSILHPSIMVYFPQFSFYVNKTYRYIPQALYMPDDTIRVGEYLHKASTKMIDDVIEETRVTYSTYNDEHPFQEMGRWDMGYYSCGMAFFAPAGALDLEANTVTHTSSNEAILKVEQDECQAGKEFYEKIRIRAVAPGEATLTVRWKDLSTTARIVVIE